MRYEKTFSNFIDIFKGLCIGSFVASMVGFFLNDKMSWILILFGFIFLFTTVLFSIVYDRKSRGYKNE